MFLDSNPNILTVNYNCNLIFILKWNKEKRVREILLRYLELEQWKEMENIGYLKRWLSGVELTEAVREGETDCDDWP